MSGGKRTHDDLQRTEIDDSSNVEGWLDKTTICGGKGDTEIRLGKTTDLHAIVLMVLRIAIDFQVVGPPEKPGCTEPNPHHIEWKEKYGIYQAMPDLKNEDFVQDKWMIYFQVLLFLINASSGYQVRAITEHVHSIQQNFFSLYGEAYEAKEEQWYHGTDIESLPGIAGMGHLDQKRDAGQNFGRGSYFTDRMWTALGYSRPNEKKGFKQLLLIFAVQKTKTAPLGMKDELLLETDKEGELLQMREGPIHLNAPHRMLPRPPTVRYLVVQKENAMLLKTSVEVVFKPKDKLRFDTTSRMTYHRDINICNQFEKPDRSNMEMLD